MNNQNNINGNQNITIQGVTESTISLNVNGEIREINNKLDVFEELLKKMQVQTFQTADKIYNINSINEANFAFVTGKKAFNELLTKTIIEAIGSSNKEVEDFLKDVAQLPNWESKGETSSEAKEIIIANFVGVIGIELRKLISIGAEAFSEDKQHKYIRQCLFISKRSLDLICFGLLSKLWDHQIQKTNSLKDAYRKVIQDFFDSKFDFSINQEANLLTALLEVYEEHALELPFSELKYFSSKLKKDGEFIETCNGLNTLKETFDKGQFTLLDCFEAERLLANLLKHFYFLANYQMASIQKIGYKAIRNATPQYLHRYMPVSGKNDTAYKNAEKIKYTTETVHSDSVLIYKGEGYEENIDLFPFVIDYNALTLVGGVKIYFYRCLNRSDGSLKYISLNPEKNKEEEFLLIKNMGNLEMDLNELMKDENKRKEINLDMVVQKFKEARKGILGEADVVVKPMKT